MALTNMVIMPGSDYQDICDAIREKTGSTDVIKSGDMADQIRNIAGNSTEMCTVTFVNNSDDSIKLYPKYEGCSDSIDVDRFESASVTVPKNSVVWFTGWVPLGGYATPDTAGSIQICSYLMEGMAAIYSDGSITICNN